MLILEHRPQLPSPGKYSSDTCISEGHAEFLYNKQSRLLYEETF